MDGITYRTTDNTRWGAGKGSNLTPTEIDLDLWELYTRLVALETSPPTPVMITDVVVIGSQFRIEMSDGSHFGPFDLPIAQFEFRGEWANNVPYYKLDLVTVKGRGLYMSDFDHTSANTGPFDPDLIDVPSGDHVWVRVFGEDTYIYDFGFFYPGKPGIGIDDGYAIAGHIFGRDVMLLQDMEVDAYMVDAPAADMSFDIQIDGVVKGQLEFAAGENDGTLTWAADVQANEGSRLRLMKPTGGIDTDARELSVTFKGLQGTFT